MAESDVYIPNIIESQTACAGDRFTHFRHYWKSGDCFATLFFAAMPNKCLQLNRKCVQGCPVCSVVLVSDWQFAAGD